jgi:hypothetical protein
MTDIRVASVQDLPALHALVERAYRGDRRGAVGRMRLICLMTTGRRWRN